MAFFSQEEVHGQFLACPCPPFSQLHVLKEEGRRVGKAKKAEMKKSSLRSSACHSDSILYAFCLTFSKEKSIPPV